MKNTELTLFWFRRDLRLDDNTALFHALNENKNVLPVFIFDKEILSKLNPQDQRIQFIHDQLCKIKNDLNALGSDIFITHDYTLDFFKKIISEYKIKSIYTNHDYEAYGRTRDQSIEKLCFEKNILFKTYKDHVVFEKSEIQSDTYKPYTVYTPYKKKWLSLVTADDLKSFDCKKLYSNFLMTADLDNQTSDYGLPTLGEMNFHYIESSYPPLKLTKTILQKYADLRDFPYELEGTSKLGVHLRFGTTSIRYLASIAKLNSDVWLSELIWRDFFNQVLWHNPDSEHKSFKIIYENINWSSNADDLLHWKNGTTGYPLVDAGMRELNATGHMHNRVRMVTASFLTKHLLQHWKTGERYFAEKLYDYDLSANVGNWQWAAGTGCDAAPYFRIFNPTAQQERFDPKFEYIKKWIPEFGTSAYPKPIVDHVFARERCLTEYKKGLGK